LAELNFSAVASSEQPLKCGDLTGRILGVFYDVYNELGNGFLESVYEESMTIALHQAGMAAEKQVPVPVWFRGSKSGISAST
jgi:GxxExxY protein